LDSALHLEAAPQRSGTLSLIEANPFPGEPLASSEPSSIATNSRLSAIVPGGRESTEELAAPLSAESPELREALESFGWLPGVDQTADPNDED